jgi:hypothetical protein
MRACCAPPAPHAQRTRRHATLARVRLRGTRIACLTTPHLQPPCLVTHTHACAFSLSLGAAAPAISLFAARSC